MVQPNTNRKLYTQNGISIATFLGGPAAAGHLIRLNYRRLGKEREGLIALILGIIATAAIFAGLFSLPESTVDNIPQQLIPAIYTAIIYGIVQWLQGKELKAASEQNAPFESNWKAAGIGGLWMLILGGVLVTYIFAEQGQADQDINQKLALIDKNEQQALRFYSIDHANTPPEVQLELITNGGINHWEENLSILQDLTTEYELEPEFASYITNLTTYNQLRLDTYRLIQKSILEGTDQYNDQIQEKNVLIADIMTQMGAL
ncbi:hypothetical protein [Marinoscillum furvescens]|uniref:Uncharacterized protein n=1 Tax=Marinoscillum furvescens DSM 4134 TaxID=1122208 RepID=A0A3D9L848_MARFU|nr:hypothetical protein [Marinoscillum furvescens]REE01047.1 hypothetical protein C7460_10466 [Marinoscillum furvescens DSM 4134]